MSPIQGCLAPRSCAYPACSCHHAPPPIRPQPEQALRASIEGLLRAIGHIRSCDMPERAGEAYCEGCQDAQRQIDFARLLLSAERAPA